MICCILLFTNVVRVLVLVTLYEVVQWHGAAELVHVPLGIAMFSVSCIAGWNLLDSSQSSKVQPQSQAEPLAGAQPDMQADSRVGGQLYRETDGQAAPQLASASAFSFRNRLPLLIILCSLGIAIAGKAPPLPFSTTLSATDTRLLAQLTATPLSLSKAESDFFSAKKNTKALKWGFATGNIAGEILLVSSTSLNGIHSPEICFMGNGMVIDSVREQTMGSVQCTVISFKNSRKRAVYWLQQGDYTTQSFLERFWRHVVYGDMQWSMKAVLLDTRENLNNESVEQVLRTLHQLQNTQGKGV